MKKVEFHYDYQEREKKLFEEMYERLSNDERIQHFLNLNSLNDTFLQSNINKFNHWIMELDECSTCEGLDACRKKNTGKVLSVEYADTLMFVEAACSYLIKKIEKETYLSNFWICDIPENLTEVSLKDIDLKGENSDYLSIVKRLALWLSEEKPNTGYYLYGDVGVGKTFLTACIANDYARREKKVAFAHVPTFSLRIRNFLDDKLAFEKEIYRLKNVDLLVFDDIGAESGSSWFRDEILLPILNYRMEKRAITCFTSNLSQKQLEVHYKFMRNKSGNGDELNAIRIMERIRSLSHEIKLDSYNRRMK